jgi:hypothetical protein
MFGGIRTRIVFESASVSQAAFALARNKRPNHQAKLFQQPVHVLKSSLHAGGPLNTAATLCRPFVQVHKY